jgi:hypothetical protein
MINYCGEGRWKQLFDRASAAREDAAAAVRRADELHALITSVARNDVVCCAWCGRIGPNGSRDPTLLGGRNKRFSTWRLPPSTRRRLSHGICMECYQRVASTAAVERAAVAPDGLP